MGINVMVSGYKHHYSFVRYLQKFNIKNFGLVMGALTFEDLFNEKYYEDLTGGILQAFGRLVVKNNKLYIYPATKKDDHDTIITSKNIVIDKKLSHLYSYLLDNDKIADIENYDKDKLHIYAKEVVKDIKNDENDWELNVPEKIAERIKNNAMFGYKKTI